MPKEISALIEEVEGARQRVLNSVENLSHEQFNFRASEDEWSIVQIVEHLVRAEEGGTCGMFKAIEGEQTGQPIWAGVSENLGLTIEEIVERTWQLKEKVPEVAAPKWGGPLHYWVARLENCEHLLKDLKENAEDVDLEAAIFPHPISGPLNIIQRLEFLRFHMERHLGQIERVKSHKDFPRT